MRNDNEATLSLVTSDTPVEKLPWEPPVMTQFSVTDVTGGTSQLPSQVIDGIQYS